MDEPTGVVDLAKPFQEMAERITKNRSESFGGAFVIVPPTGAGEPMQAVTFNTGTDPAAFWMLLQAQINVTLENLKANQASPYGMPRR